MSVLLAKRLEVLEVSWKCAHRKTSRKASSEFCCGAVIHRDRHAVGGKKHQADVFRNKNITTFKKRKQNTYSPSKTTGGK